MKVKRPVLTVKDVDIEVTGKNGPNGPIPPDSLWESLKRKCFICSGKMKAGDLYYMCIYLENGHHRSGACHVDCLNDNENLQ